MAKKLGALWLLLAAVGLSSAVGLGLVEWVVRYKEAHRTSVPGSMPYLYYRHARYGQALVRGMNYFGWVHVDREGFRGPEVSLVPPPGVIRIMAVGASTTMDADVSRDDAAWPARLEYWLNRDGTGRKFEVINAGVGGYHLNDNVIRFEMELYRYHPNLIILFGASHQDLLSALAAAGRSQAPSRQARPDEVATQTPWGRWLEQHSLLYGKVVKRWLAMRGQFRGARHAQGTSSTDFGQALAEGAQAFGHDLTGFLTLAAAAGIPVVVPATVYMGYGGALSRDSAAILAAWHVTVPQASASRMFEGYARYDSVTRAVASAYGATYLPAADSGFGDRSLYAEEDAVHFNDRGAEREAKSLAAALERLEPWKQSPVVHVDQAGKPAPAESRGQIRARAASAP